MPLFSRHGVYLAVASLGFAIGIFLALLPLTSAGLSLGEGAPTDAELLLRRLPFRRVSQGR